MSVSLGGIALDDNLGIPGFKNLPKVLVSSQMTIGARAVVNTALFDTGHFIQLEGKGSGDKIYGSFTGTQVDQINALLEAAVEVTFVHHLGTWTVMIESIDVVEIWDYANPGATDIYVGTINMIITG